MSTFANQQSETAAGHITVPNKWDIFDLFLVFIRSFLLFL